MSKTLHGNIDIEIDGVIYHLRPTLAAVRAIEARFGGLRGAASALHAVSVDGAAFIIAAGANLTEKQTDGLPEAVWQKGVTELTPLLNEYLAALYNPRGGEPGKEMATESAP
ncbi:hypothetical protein PSCICO_47220 [Pseudomonas cichorii]|uniref:Uncharacterized protein n=1 Tax=Pseudomonas cichorii TaxID=36746 RepID=A0ABQ1DIE3_PSECI|nr:hypothetical protein [Pseudomonas cichorii]AHF68686.1 hypothetical protein PCH70_35330 [Pseudomonas cichorii JBC1]QVE15684.1 hypothetical protein KGD89_17555 [Pseudomonas cichorii]SDN33423.1 hypothetical protein SAMN05216599_101657 [Pseudomonas cichorii]GFM89323.1 hypothetical protein PSCICO_47220 [Pseudomonas cichorii]GFM90791.1 hypothetical protein PSCICP_07630 [Pseudomonas cichorii]